MHAHMLCMHVCGNFVLCHVCMDACVHVHVHVYSVPMLHTHMCLSLNVLCVHVCLVLLGKASRPPRGAQW